MFYCIVGYKYFWIVNRNLRFVEIIIVLWLYVYLLDVLFGDYGFLVYVDYWNVLN